MGIASALRKVYLGKQSAVGDISAVPTHLIPVEVEITPTKTIENVSDRLDGSRAEDRERYVTEQNASITMSGQLYYELMPLLTGMVLGGGSNQPKTMPDSAAASQPNSVSSYVNSTATSVAPSPNVYSLFIDDGDEVQVIRNVYAESFEVTAEVRGACTFTASLVGHYPSEYTANIPTVGVPAGISPVLTDDWVLRVGTTAIADTLKSFTFAMPSGLQNRSTINGTVDFDRVVPARRKGTLTMTVTNNPLGQTTRDMVLMNEEAVVTLTATGDQIRTTPDTDRSIAVTANGQFINQGVLYSNENDEIVSELTFETLANASDKDVEVTSVIATDTATVKLV